MGEELGELIKKAKEWVAAEYKFITALSDATAKEDLDASWECHEQMGRAGKVAFVNLHHIRKQLKKLIKSSPKEELKNFLEERREKLYVISRQILKITSRYKGEIRKTLRKLKRNGDRKRLWEELNKELISLAKWTNGLQVEIRKLEKLVSSQGVQKAA